MKVLLVRSLMDPLEGALRDLPWMPPLAIYSLASILKEKGFEVQIVDPYYYGYKLADPLLLKQILRNADIFCLSTTSFQWSFSIKILGALRQVCPKIPVIVGGIHVGYFGEHIIKHFPVDYAVEGEGEETLSELLNALATGQSPKEVKGILMKDEDGAVIRTEKRPFLSVEELNQTPIPDFSQLPDKLYQVLPFETSRGCMSNCIFCSISHRGRWRGLSGNIVLDKLSEILDMYQLKFNTKSVYFVDDCFSVDQDRAINILTGIRDRKLDCSLLIEARIDQLLEGDLIECLSNNSITEIQIGVECGYDKGLKKIGKGIMFDQVITCAEKLKKFNLNRQALFSFIIGFPWENLKDACITLHAAADLVRNYDINVNTAWWILMPSRLWDQRLKYGINVNEDFFSDPLRDKKTFSQLRPLMSMNDLEIAQNIMKIYWEIGCPIWATPLA